MIQKIFKPDTDFNTVAWQDDFVSLARESDTHVRISRHQHRLSQPTWSLSIDVTSGYPLLHVAKGNRLTCVHNEHMLAITCGEYWRGESLHNYQLHYIHEDGRILWSLPWQTIQRFALIDDKLLVIRYVSPPNYWIVDTPLEAHLLELETGDSLHSESIATPKELLPYYQSWQVAELRTYLVWKNNAFVLTVRPCFRSQFIEAQQLNRRGSFKHSLSFS